MLKRPTAVTVLAVLEFIGGALTAMFVAILGVAIYVGRPGSMSDPTGFLVLPFFAASAAYQIICGVGLWRMRSYGRTMQMIAAAVGLLGIPIGTIISIVILVYLSKPGVKVLFSGKTADQLDPGEVAAVQAVTSSGAGIIILVVALGIFAVFAVGIIAAIAVPGLLRARIGANEASAIGVLRAISSAEATYATVNGGYYDSQHCLVQPSECIPGYRGGSFLAEEYTVRAGYRFQLAGSPLRDRRPGSSPTSLERFVVVAAPVSSSTGIRVFCVDDTGVVRSPQIPGPGPTGSSCPASWPPVE